MWFHLFSSRQVRMCWPGSSGSARSALGLLGVSLFLSLGLVFGLPGRSFAAPTVPPTGNPTTKGIVAPIVIPPGSDCWATECGNTQLTFCDTYGTTIPAGFFDPGSEPFQGEILFGGDGGLFDTQMQRFGQMVLPDLGSQAMVPIQMEELSLQSCQPITVVIDGAPVDWDVAATLSNQPSGMGQLNVLRTHENGGTFQAEFPLHIRFTFTRVDNPTVEVVLDSGLMGLPPFPFLTTGEPPWVAAVSGPTPPLVCGVGFVPGLNEDPITLEQCCHKVGHAGPGHIHETGPPDCSACPEGACCDALAGTCTVTSIDACTGEFKGFGTDCLDSDGDGIADILENNSCCSDRNSCNRGTDPNNPDTDGDGIDDGVELALGLNPCVSDEFFGDGFELGDLSLWALAVP